MKQILDKSWIAGLRACFAPPVCELCVSLVPMVPTLCEKCAADLHPLNGPSCRVCALPFPSMGLASHLCGDCLVRPPSFEKVVSVFQFEGAAAKLLHLVKFGGRIQAFDPFLPKAARKFQEAVLDFAPDMILPIPLGWWRRFRRGFNQSTVLAEQLQRNSNCRILPAPVVRRSLALPQAQKKRSDRLKAMRGAFRVRPAAIWRERRILLVDDVLTTGATAEALSAALRHAGASRVQVFTLARVGKKL